MSACLSVCQFVCLSSFLSSCLSVCLFLVVSLTFYRRPRHPYAARWCTYTNPSSPSPVMWLRLLRGGFGGRRCQRGGWGGGGKNLKESDEWIGGEQKKGKNRNGDREKGKYRKRKWKPNDFRSVIIGMTSHNWHLVDITSSLPVDLMYDDVAMHDAATHVTLDVRCRHDDVKMTSIILTLEINCRSLVS